MLLDVVNQRYETNSFSALTSFCKGIFYGVVHFKRQIEVSQSQTFYCSVFVIMFKQS